jgi:hypothetical protein
LRPRENLAANLMKVVPDTPFSITSKRRHEAETIFMLSLSTSSTRQSLSSASSRTLPSISSRSPARPQSEIHIQNPSYGILESNQIKNY